MSDTKGSAVLDPIQDGALDRPIRGMLENARQSPAFLLLHALPYTPEVFAAVAEVAPAEDLQNAVRQWGQWVPAQVVAAAVDVFSEAPWVLADIASIVPATKLAEVVADPAFPASNLHPLGLALPKAALPDAPDRKTVSELLVRSEFDRWLVERAWKLGYRVNAECVRAFCRSTARHRERSAWYVANMAPTASLRRQVISRWFHAAAHSQAAFLVASTPEALEVADYCVRCCPDSSIPPGMYALMLARPSDPERWEDVMTHLIEKRGDWWDLSLLAANPSASNRFLRKLRRFGGTEVYQNRSLLQEAMSLPPHRFDHWLRRLDRTSQTAVRLDLGEWAQRQLKVTQFIDPVTLLYSRAATAPTLSQPKSLAPLRPPVVKVARGLRVTLEPNLNELSRTHLARSFCWADVGRALVEVCGSDRSKWALVFHLLGPALPSLPHGFTARDLVATVAS